VSQRQPELPRAAGPGRSDWELALSLSREDSRNLPVNLNAAHRHAGAPGPVGRVQVIVLAFEPPAAGGRRLDRPQQHEADSEARAWQARLSGPHWMRCPAGRQV
jgi:hypothetical protein